MSIKVEIIEDRDYKKLEKMINDFAKLHEIIDVKYAVVECDAVYYSALIIYKR